MTSPFSGVVERTTQKIEPLDREGSPCEKPRRVLIVAAGKRMACREMATILPRLIASFGDFSVAISRA
jgi:hypothetical protein